MKFDRNALELMRQTVLIRKKIGQDRFNRNIYETDANNEPVYTRYRALVTLKPEQIRTANGEEKVARSRTAIAPVVVDADDHLIYLDDLPDIGPDDEITMPDGSKPEIIAVEEHEGTADLHHILIRS